MISATQGAVTPAMGTGTHLMVSGAEQPAPKLALANAYGRLPLSFEKNDGQADRKAKFVARGHDYSLFLTRTGAIFASTATNTGSSEVMRMRFGGADRRPEMTGMDRRAGVTNYYIGKDPDSWITKVPSYARVAYRDIYPGIDAVFYGNSKGELEYDFEVAPGADPTAIQMVFSGGSDLELGARGDLLVRTDAGTIRQERPFAYQETPVGRRRVPSRYVLGGERRVALRLGHYDGSVPLVIDPVLDYGTYLGGELGAVHTQETSTAIAVDGEGSAYVTGFTPSGGFPTTSGASQPGNAGGSGGSCGTAHGKELPCRDAFVTKLSPDGSDLIYSTYFGGVGPDEANGIAVDASGHAYIAGSTAAQDLPTTPDAYQRTAPQTSTECSSLGRNCIVDGFVAKLSPDGGRLSYATYLAGTDHDEVRAIAVDGAGNAYVAGATMSADFPSSGSLRSYAGEDDAFVTVLDPSGSHVTFSTFLGSASSDTAQAIAIGPGGDAFVTGTTYSETFPTTQGVFMRTTTGIGDAFVARIDPHPGATTLEYATLLGGEGSDAGHGIGVDEEGRAYVVGNTYSSTLPQAANAPAGDQDVFVARISATASALEYLRYLGGSGNDMVGYRRPGGGMLLDGTTIAVDAPIVHVAGSSESMDFPEADTLQERDGNQEAFVASVDTEASELVMSSYLGGPQDEGAKALAADERGNLYMTGRAQGGGFPTLGWGDRPPDRNGYSNAFVAKVSPVEPGPLVRKVEPISGPTGGGMRVKITGSGLAAADAVAFGDVTLPCPSPLCSIGSDGDITATSPPHPSGPTVVSVTTPAGTSPRNAYAKFTYAEGGWSMTAPMAVGRWAHSATLLHNGQVLVAGGWTMTEQTPGELSMTALRSAGLSLPVELSMMALRSAELFDPVTETWVPTKEPMNTPRSGHSATLLNDGRVLVVGGCCDGGGDSSTAEVYDPDTGRWSPAGGTSEPFTEHTATLLPDGRVLILRGDAGTTAIYDPESSAESAWTEAEQMLQQHRRHSATLIGSEVFVVGDRDLRDGSSLLSAEIYDPATDHWKPGRDPDLEHQGHSGTLLSDGRLLIVGGAPENYVMTSELYDPVTDSWAPATSLNNGRYQHEATLLPSGKNLVTGGAPFYGATREAEIFLPGTKHWRSAGYMAVQREDHTATLLSSDPRTYAGDPSICGDNCGRVLVVGGYFEDLFTPKPFRSSELYTPPPELHTASPGTGPASGGSRVVLTGRGFTNGVSQVSIGDALATDIDVESDNQMTVTTPPHARGTFAITVLNEGGTARLDDAFVYLSDPGEVADLKAQPLSGSEIKLTFSAPAALDSTESPQRPAQRFVIKQSRTPITTDEEFAAAGALCNGVCSFTPPIQKIGDQVSLTVEDLAPATTYHYALKVIDASEVTGPLSNAASASTAATTPGAVGDLTAEPLSETKIKLSFSAAGSDGTKPPPIGDYVIVQSNDPITDERTFGDARPLCPDACNFGPQAVGETLTVEVSDLTPGTAYHYALRPRDPNGNLGPRSNSASATTQGRAATDGQASPVERVIRLKLEGHLVATGRIRTQGPRACVRKIKVVIHRNGKKIKTLTTDRDGRYRVRLADRAGRYRVNARKVAIGDKLCLRARSPARRHRH